MRRPRSIRLVCASMFAAALLLPAVIEAQTPFTGPISGSGQRFHTRSDVGLCTWTESYAFAGTINATGTFFTATGTMTEIRSADGKPQCGTQTFVLPFNIFIPLTVSGAQVSGSTTGAFSFSFTGFGDAPTIATSSTITGTLTINLSDGIYTETTHLPAVLSRTLPTLPVAIDVKPGSFPNSINLTKQGVIPVGILSTPTRDITTLVDPGSLTFGSTGDEESLRFCAVEDVNGDGLQDLICHFDAPLAGFQPGDVTGVLKGHTTSGRQILGTDSVRTIPDR